MTARISRREFVEGSAWSVAGWSLLRPSGLGGGGTHAAAGSDCAVLDLGVDCSLRESLRGFQKALGTNPINVQEIWNRRPCSLTVVPGVARMDSRLARILLDLLEAGTSVLVESGAGFSSAREFGVHREMLNNAFGIGVESPVDVWSRLADGITPTCAPYVEYDWPCRTLVRDFSRMIPVVAERPDVIAWTGLLAVGMKKRVGKGTLVFLGSPLGPALLAGDPEAREWVRSVVTACA